MAKKKKESINIFGLELNTPSLLILLIIVIVILAKKGYLGGGETIITYVNNQTVTNMLETEAGKGTCSISANLHNLELGDKVTGTIIDGANTQCAVYGKYNAEDWRFIKFVTTGDNGKYSETFTPETAGTFYFGAICGSCVTNIEELWITVPAAPPEPDVPSVGDIVWTGGGSGSLTKDDYSSLDTIYLTGLEVGGPCQVGARIHTEMRLSDTANNGPPSGECWVMDEQSYVDTMWEFWDSSRPDPVWYAYDEPMVIPPDIEPTMPMTNDVDLCPLYWDGVNPWQMKVISFIDWDMDCQVSYSYSIEAYLCECD